jgi:hypothetical protein
MKPIDEILLRVNKTMDSIEQTKIGATHNRTEQLEDLALCFHWLTEHRDKAHKDWMSYYFGSKANSSAAKEREADMRCPELYTIRHLMTSVKLVIDSLRTSISANKHG